MCEGAEEKEMVTGLCQTEAKHASLMDGIQDNSSIEKLISSGQFILEQSPGKYANFSWYIIQP
jgi:hypothetical protein